MLRNRIYYNFKPLVPRYMQIILRRYLVNRQIKRSRDIWPIDEQAGAAPTDWSGWPENKDFAFVLMHDVDTQKGHDKVNDVVNLEETLGLKSSFNFCPKRYNISTELRSELVNRGFEVGVHGLKHDGKLYMSKETFQRSSVIINGYMREWNSVGFSSPSMHSNLEWNHDLNIEYDISTFDTDPFEPYPGGVQTIFPFWVSNNSTQNGYVELPYTIPQDFTLFVLMQEQTIDIWKKKLDWVATNGGMALLNTHPDYMNFKNRRCTFEEYPMEFYRDFLIYVKSKYKNRYWNPLPMDMARFWRGNILNTNNVREYARKSVIG